MANADDWAALASEIINLPQLEVEEISSQIEHNIYDMRIIKKNIPNWSFDTYDEAVNLHDFRSALARYHFLAWVVRTRLLDEPDGPSKNVLLHCMERHRNASNQLLRAFGPWFGEVNKRSPQ